MGPPAALDAMAAWPQWGLWQLTDSRKVPISATTGRPHNPHDPANWLAAADAYRLAAERQCGVAFSFTDADPFWFLDLDKCYSAAGWSPRALEVCRLLDGAAVEVSQSGRGLHLFGTGTLPPHGCKNAAEGLELYHTGRFVALSGKQVLGDAGTDHTAALGSLVPRFFPPSTTATAGSADWTTEPAPQWRGPSDDTELVRRMLKSTSVGGAFGGKASIRSLWNGDADALAAAFPPIGPGDFDNSAADAALCAHLAFWTGRDCERIDRLFRQSGLYRDKWERDDYRTGTVTGAVGVCRDVYGSQIAEAEQRPAPPPPVARDTKPLIREGYQFLGIDQQLDRFAGCVYVRSRHEVFLPDGDLLGPGAFRAAYGGYVYPLDGENKRTTRNAWEAFTESQVISHPRANSVCFRPDQTPGGIIEEEGRALVNLYVPVPIRRLQGDASPFLDLLARMLPDQGDRDTLLAYMAACVQYPGVKFQWSPVVQGTEGNGKTALMDALSYAVGRRYTHRLNAHDLKENALKFNYWLEGKLLIGVDEIYISDRRDIIEALKEYITSDRKEIQPKGANQYMGDNRANFLFFSNHRDAVPISRNGRRYSVFYCAQQSIDDLRRCGMGGQYMPRLWRWLKADGYAIVAQYLQDYAIPDALNPATCAMWAPATSSTNEALGISLGGIEQEILEAVDQGRAGFCGGWLSSMALDRLLQERHESRKLPRSKRRDVLADLGYTPHPGLSGGRVNNHIGLDGGKPRLYVTDAHLSTNLDSPQAIADAYVKAQEIKPFPVEGERNVG